MPDAKRPDEAGRDQRSEASDDTPESSPENSPGEPGAPDSGTRTRVDIESEGGTPVVHVSVDAPDPITDIDHRHHEAGVDEGNPFGRPGDPLHRGHPFVFGFTGALGVFTAWLLVQAIRDARQVLILIVVSLFLAIGLNPAVERVKRLGVPRGGAVAIVFLCLILAVAAIGYAIVRPLVTEIDEFIDHLPNFVDDLKKNEELNELIEKHDIEQKVTDFAKDPKLGEKAFGGVLGVGKAVLGGLLSLLTVSILTLYFLASLPQIKSFFYRLAPRSRRARVAVLGDEILSRIGGYISGTVMVATIAGSSAFIFLWILGMDFKLPLALMVGLTAFIPLVGATIGAVVVTTVAFFDGTGKGIACIIFFLIYQQVENYVIHPRVMKRAVDVHPAVTIVAALIGGAMLGFVGALLAIPTAAAVALIIREVAMPRQDSS